jgi:hypothetical protein
VQRTLFPITDPDPAAGGRPSAFSKRYAQPRFVRRDRNPKERQTLDKAL